MLSKKNVYLFVLLFFLQSCRIVPIQTARVIQVDSYEQTYNLQNEAQAANVLQKLVGEKNWEILLDYLGSNTYFEELQKQQIMVKGNIIISVTLDPQNHNHFLGEGFGRYYVLRKTTNELLFSADYRVLEEMHSIDVFEKKSMFTVAIQQFMIRHFPTEGEKNYFHESPFEMNIFLTSPQEGVYSVDYSKPHELIIDNKVVGYLNFSPSLTGKKLIDLRDMNYIKDDYK